MKKLLFLLALLSCDAPEVEIENVDTIMDLANPTKPARYRCGESACSCDRSDWEGIKDCLRMNRNECRGNRIVCLLNLCWCSPNHFD